jgi:hypothetical protein
MVWSKLLSLEELHSLLDSERYRLMGACNSSKPSDIDQPACRVQNRIESSPMQTTFDAEGSECLSVKPMDTRPRVHTVRNDEQPTRDDAVS